ncbi:MAG: ribosomal L7Ae/L30e/S12e/Gadd45 family protein [Prevotella sp.]|nr:ribosomal L7Ae/L30e/S12e/Gadd45 family protein [Prevotella sp.]
MNSRENRDKLFGLLTICRKAGQLALGFDPMKEALDGGRARAVLTAADISPKTEKEVRFFADKRGVPVRKTEMTLEEISRALGKKAGVLTVCGEGFAEKALSLCTEE